MKKLKNTLKTLVLTMGLFGLSETYAQAQPEGPVYSVIATWIGDHDYILPYRKEALPFVLDKGAKWTHLYFPDSFFHKGFDLQSSPDEIHIMSFDGIEHMQSIFSAPEYTAAAEKYFYKAFSHTLAFPAFGADPAKGETGNFENYFVVGVLDLPNDVSPAQLVDHFKTSAAKYGLKSAKTLNIMMPTGNGAPNFSLVASFQDKESFDQYMKEGQGLHFFEKTTDRYFIAGGYDTKRPVS